MGKIIIPLLLIFGFSFQESPTKIIWKNLEDVSFEEAFLKEYDDWFLIPKFGAEVKKLDGKTVIIKGYIIPMDLEGEFYALSAFSFSSCFFCGGAGPESVMTLKFDKKPKAFKTDDVVTFKGQFELNNTNPDDFSYILNHATEIEK